MDGALVDWRTVERFNTDWSAEGRRWSAAVWDAAEALGPAPIDDAMRSAGVALALRPLLICGSHRSGTTLLRDLLDGHPALSVLPSESHYFRNQEGPLAALEPAVATRRWGEEWLRRLANPVNLPPFWLLGRSCPVSNRYVDFARAMLAWSTELRATGTPCWPLPAVALAHAGAIGASWGALLHWAEKTPDNERHLAHIWRMFPQARAIHIVRRPEDVAASIHALVDRSLLDRNVARAMLRRLTRSYAHAARLTRTMRPDSYFLVRYEQLVADPETVMRRVAAFLEIDFLPCLLAPTVAGLPATKNSSHQSRAPLRPGSPRPADRAWLQLAKLTYRAIPPLG